MGADYDEIAFTGPVRTVQQRYGSRAFYARRSARGHAARPDRLTDDVRQFLSGLDGFFLATVGDSGWPYVQFRGGPPGFVKVLDGQRLGWADFRGNLQYISVGNISATRRVALIALDYPTQQRLKLFGHARVAYADEDPELVASLTDSDYEASVERAVIVTVAGLDWNCRQHITPRFTEAELGPRLSALRARLTALEAENTQLRQLLDAAAAPSQPQEKR